MNIKGEYEFYITPERIIIYDNNQLKLDRAIADVNYLLDQNYSSSGTVSYDYIVFNDNERYELTKAWNTGLSTKNILTALKQVNPNIDQQVQKNY